MNIDTAISDTDQDAVNKHDIVPNVQGDTSGAKVIVSGVRSDVVNTSTVVSDIHRDKLKSREGVDGQNQPVSIIRTLPVTE